MWPVDLYTISGAPVVDSIAFLGTTDLEVYRSLEPVERAGIQFAGTLLAAMVILGLLQGYSTRTVAKSRRSPVISLCIGLPGLLVVGFVLAVGYLIVGTSLGMFFGIPAVIGCLVTLSTATVVGLAAIGQTVTARLGYDTLWAGALAGSLIGGSAGLAVPATAVVAVLAAALGLGAGVRVLLGGAGAANPNERTVPPANRI